MVVYASNEGRDSRQNRNYDIWLMAADGSKIPPPKGGGESSCLDVDATASTSDGLHRDKPGRRQAAGHCAFT
jgi:hypothetical protein